MESDAQILQAQIQIIHQSPLISVGSVTSSTEISGLDIIASKTSVKFLWTNPTDSDYKGLEIYDEKDNKICHVDKSVQSLERSSLAIDTCYVWSFKTTFGMSLKMFLKPFSLKLTQTEKIQAI